MCHIFTILLSEWYLDPPFTLKLANLQTLEFSVLSYTNPIRRNHSLDSDSKPMHGLPFFPALTVFYILIWNSLHSGSGVRTLVRTWNWVIIIELWRWRALFTIEPKVWSFGLTRVGLRCSGLSRTSSEMQHQDLIHDSLKLFWGGRYSVLSTEISETVLLRFWTFFAFKAAQNVFED